MSSFSSQMKTLITLLSTLVPQVLHELQIPGCSVGVVYKDEIFARGYGKVGTGFRQTDVNRHTRFPIGSLTKGFLTALLAIYVEQGRISWNDKITKHLRGFRLSSKAITDKLTIHHLAAHIGGLPPYGGDLLLYPATTYSRLQIVARLADLPIDENQFGQYAYSNLGYIILGALLEQITGHTIEDLFAIHIFNPLRLTDTVAPLSAIVGGNVALPHMLVNGRLTQIKPYTSANNAPVGGIGSSAFDMVTWMVRCLDKGDGLFSPASWDTLTTGRASMSLPAPPPGLEPIASTYRRQCYGWEERDFRGRHTVGYAGGIFGFSSRMVLLPPDIGVIVLTNRESIAALSTILYSAIDHLLGIKQFDWLNGWRAWERKGEEDTRQAVQAAIKSCDRKSRPAISEMVGRYRSPWYGDVRIEQDFFSRPVINFLPTPGLRTTLQRCSDTTFIAHFRDLQLTTKVTFTPSAMDIKVVAGDLSYYDMGRLGLRRL